MTAPGPSAPRLARARHPDDEVRYRAVLELDAGGTDEREELFLRLEDESWRVRTAAVERLAALADPLPLLPRLLGLLETGETIGGKDAAAATLVRVGAPAVTALVARLGGADPGAELAALAVLGDIGVRRAVPALTARLASPDANVRAAAAEALGKVGGPEAATSLLAALDSDDLTLQAAALEALCAIGVAPPCHQLARLVSRQALRRAAYRSLGWSEEPAALDLLASGLAEPGRSAREAALAAIGQLRARLGNQALSRLAAVARATAGDETRVAERFVGALGSEEPFVAEGALAVLAWVGQVRHAPAMARLAEHDRYRPLVEEALEALPRGAELLAVLSQSLPELTPLARLAVQGALAVAGDVTALHALVQAASDADPELQTEAIATLGRLGDSRAVPSLGGLLGDDLPALSGVAASALIRVAMHSTAGRSDVLLECRARAAASPSAAIFRILGAVGEGEDLRLVRQGLAVGVGVRRMAAAAAAAAMGHRGLLRGERVPELVAALGDLAWSVRAAAARAFVELGRAQAAPLGTAEPPLDAAAVAALRGAMGDPEPAVRAAVVEALGATGQPEHAQRIAEVASDPATPPMVALAALHALARLGAASATVLERGLSHPDAEVVKEAVAAAVRLPGEEGSRLLRQAAGSPRWDVRHAAARGMAERRDPSLGAEAARLAASDPDPLVARAFADTARALGAVPGR